jgi:predicted XRE-type DNA-binding protein
LSKAICAECEAKDNMKTRMYKGVKVTMGSGNVFLDLGFGKTEAEDLKRRSSLMMRVHQFVKESKLTNEDAAQALGISETRLNLLVKGEIGRFSVDGLRTMLSNADVQLEGALEELTP